MLLQISDTHFGTEQPVVVEALLSLKESVRPEVVVWSGDITQRARRAQFNSAQQFLRRLGDCPVITIPGNHDIPLFNVLARALYPYAGYSRVFGRDLEPRYASDDFLILGVKTTRRYRHVDGEISAEQIERVSRELRAAPAHALRIVVTHQPVHVTKEKDEKNLIHGNAAAARAWTQAGADVVMGGHIHLPFIRPLSERFSGLARRAWIVQAGTAISNRVRHSAPNSVNLIRRDPHEPLLFHAERWDFDSVLSRFTRVAVHALNLQR